MTKGLAIEHLFVSHRRGPDVVHDVSIKCPRGAVTALLGPNGAGKSTLLKAIAGVLPSRGDVLLDGVSVTNMDLLERAKTIAYVPQHSRLAAEMSVYDVVDQGRFAHRGPLARSTKADQEAIYRALEEVDASELQNRPYTELSAGEQQKVLVARALATGAHTLLLDEPTAALDARHVLIFHALLRRLVQQQWCILAVFHALDEVYRHADYAVLMSQGRVHRTGGARDIVGPGPVREIYSVELRYNAGIGLFLEGKRSAGA